MALQVGGHYTPLAGDVHFRHVTSGACTERERIPTSMRGFPNIGKSLVLNFCFVLTVVRFDFFSFFVAR